MGTGMSSSSGGGDQPRHPLRPSDVVLTSIKRLGSQGIFTARDGSVAMVHESTTPRSYYRASYDNLPAHDSFINMDRGGFGRAPEGTTFGCVFDGVSSGGPINAFAAQAFTQHTLGWLRDPANRRRLFRRRSRSPQAASLGLCE